MREGGRGRRHRRRHVAPACGLVRRSRGGGRRRAERGLPGRRRARQGVTGRASRATGGGPVPGVSPLVAIDVGLSGRPLALLLKLENRSPAGSIKVRTARSLVDALDSQGRLPAGATLSES